MRILFICYEIYERPAKIARILKDNGYEVDVIYRHFTDIIFLKNFDYAFCLKNLKSIDHFTKQKKYFAIHYFSKGTDKYSVDLIESELPFIYDYKDIFEGILNLPQSNVLYSLQHDLIFRSYAVTFRDGQFHEYISRNKYIDKSKKLFLPDFITEIDVTMNRNRDFSICFGGNLIIEKIDPHYSGLGQLSIAREIVKQDIQYHLYPFHHNFSDKNSSFMSDYIELKDSNNNFFLHNRLNQREYIKEISQHSFGSQILSYLHFQEFCNLHYLIEPIAGLPSRISDYISAEIPIIIDNSFVEPASIVKHYEIGVVLNPGDLFILKDILKSFNYKRMKINLHELKRKKISESKYHIDLLRDLYNEFYELHKKKIADLNRRRNILSFFLSKNLI